MQNHTDSGIYIICAHLWNPWEDYPQDSDGIQTEEYPWYPWENYLVATDEVDYSFEGTRLWKLAGHVLEDA